MDLKFYLNKFLKVDNIENYTLEALTELKKRYEKFLDKSSGFDPDFPGLDFSGGKGKKLKGVSKAKAEGIKDPIDEQKETWIGGEPESEDPLF